MNEMYNKNSPKCESEMKKAQATKQYKSIFFLSMLYKMAYHFPHGVSGVQAKLIQVRNILLLLLRCIYVSIMAIFEFFGLFDASVCFCRQDIKIEWKEISCK